MFYVKTKVDEPAKESWCELAASSELATQLLVYNLSTFLHFSKCGHFPQTAFTVELLLRSPVLRVKITSFRILSLSTPAMASRIVKSPAVQVILLFLNL